MKLNLGSGDIVIPGYENLDAKFGSEIFPLPYDDGTIEEIRASHVLEHFPHGQTERVLKDWVRALMPGGLLKVAVPDFPSLIQKYQSREQYPTHAVLMGGQSDERDFHKAIFDFEQLAHLMRNAGLVAINAWDSEVDDCAKLPISLNLCGHKRPEKWPNVSAIMSVPRLGFMDNFFCAFEALNPLRINLRKVTGAFWGQCLERGFEMIVGDDAPEFILTLDYDTVFTRNDVEDMLALMIANPGVDALAPVQASRSKNAPLFVVAGADGKGVAIVRSDYFDAPCADVVTANFGCTLIRASALKDLPKPWFHSKPDAQGSWHNGHVDDDIFFWHRFKEAGKRLCIASRVAVGHMELMVRWPDAQMQAIHQHHSEWSELGKPEGVWH